MWEGTKFMKVRMSNTKVEHTKGKKIGFCSYLKILENVTLGYTES